MRPAVTGHGVFVGHDGAQYEGCWPGGIRNCLGTMVSARGDRYVGGWLSHQRHGNGVQTFADGGSYGNTVDNS